MTRPVPLDFEYRTSTLHHSVTQLLESGKAPIYLVHFTQKDATEAAQNYLALDPLSKTEKAAVKEALAGFRFDSPIGKDLRRFITAGVGVHHAGLLPKYRLLVEKLAQDGLLKIICGTDTLGVGVNVPIRSVLFTQLCKYDGTGVRLLSNREFAQIAGRAGRKGFDDRGDVWVQAPPHVVENQRLEDKSREGGGKKKVVKKKQPERGYAHWTQETFDKLVSGEPEPLRSYFRVNHQMVMSLLDRPTRDGVDGCRAVRRLLTDNHESRKRQREHIRRTIAIYRSLVEAELLEFPEHPDEWGRLVRVNFDLQDEFALHQPLSLWAVEALGALPERDSGDADGDAIEHVFDVLSVIEAVQENPGVILAAQTKRAKDDLMAEMKSSGVEYEERMERLSQVEHPKPNRDWIYGNFDEFRARHPWVGSDNVAPKSVVREMYERAMTFGEYVQDYGLKRSEGVVLRYLSDVYKGLQQNVPEDLRTPELDDVIVWLGALIRQVDSSLIDEWERLLHPDEASSVDDLRPTLPTGERSIVDDHRAFRVMVRNKMFDWVQKLARRRGYDEIVADADRAIVARRRGADRGGAAVLGRARRSPNRSGCACGRPVPFRPLDRPGHPDPARPRRHQRVAHRGRRRPGGQRRRVPGRPPTRECYIWGLTPDVTLTACDGVPASCCTGWSMTAPTVGSRCCSGTWAGRSGHARTPVPGRSRRASTNPTRTRSVPPDVSSRRRRASQCRWRTSSISARCASRAARWCGRGQSKVTSMRRRWRATPSRWSGRRSPAHRRRSPNSTVSNGSTSRAHARRSLRRKPSSWTGWPSDHRGQPQAVRPQA